jgi:hypothetical protein
MSSMSANPPGSRWMLILGGIGFAAGFFGPIIFVPDANQGPLVGILITGPGGFVLGAVLWFACRLFKASAATQWRMLYATAAVGVLTILLCVQPAPKLRGYVFDGLVNSCATPSDTEAEVLDYWNERIAQVTWAQPRAGWQADMHQLLRAAPGAVISVRMDRKNAIKENRKPWNSGSQFAAGWTTEEDDTSFYDANGSCDQYPNGSAIRGYQQGDYEARLSSVDIWPPVELLYVLRASALAPVPAGWTDL